MRSLGSTPLAAPAATPVPPQLWGYGFDFWRERRDPRSAESTGSRLAQLTGEETATCASGGDRSPWAVHSKRYVSGSLAFTSGGDKRADRVDSLITPQGTVVRRSQRRKYGPWTGANSAQPSLDCQLEKPLPAVAVCWLGTHNVETHEPLRFFATRRLSELGKLFQCRRAKQNCAAGFFLRSTA